LSIRIFTYIGLIYLIAIRAYSQPIPNNDVFQINTYTTGYPAEIRSLMDGGFVVCWNGYNQEELLNVYARIFNSDGSSRGAEFQVNSDTLIDYTLPTVAGLSDGGFVICWTQYDSEIKTIDIIGQFFTTDGSRRGNEFKVNLELEPENYHWFVIAGLKGGGFLCLWRSQIPEPIYNHGYICGQIVDENGVRIGNEFILPKQSDEDNYIPRLISLTNGSLFACWESVIQTDTGGSDINGQLFESDGNRLGDVIPISAGGFEADCCALKDGGFAVLWKEDAGYEETAQYVQYFNSDGSSRTPEILVNKFDRDDFYVYWGKIIGMEDGGIMACWDHEKAEDGLPYISFQLVDIDGNLRGTDFQVAKGALEPHGCRLPDNGFVICWASPAWEFDTISGKIFREANHTLQPFSLLEPTEDLTINTLSSILKWQKSSSMNLNFPWELQYTLYLGENENFSSHSIIDSIYDTTYTVQNLTPGATYFWKVLAKNIAGDSLWSTETNLFYVSENATSIKHPVSSNPETFELYPNYPNPFNPETTISYTLPQGKAQYPVQVRIYDILGRLVITLIDENQYSGYHLLKWNGKNNMDITMPSGVYYCVVQAGENKAVQKMLLVR
jgi:hypothetical protein